MPEEKSKKTAKKLTQAEFEKKVLELAGKKLTSEKIGQVLKDQGIHPREFSKKISKILGDKHVNPDLKNIEKKLNP